MERESRFLPSSPSGGYLSSGSVEGLVFLRSRASQTFLTPRMAKRNQKGRPSLKKPQAIRNQSKPRAARLSAKLLPQNTNASAPQKSPVPTKRSVTGLWVGALPRLVAKASRIKAAKHAYRTYFTSVGIGAPRSSGCDAWSGGAELAPERPRETGSYNPRRGHRRCRFACTRPHSRPNPVCPPRGVVSGSP